MKYFPIFLKVTGKSLIIFGGGADAAAKLRLIQKTDATIYVVADTLDTDVLDLGTATWIKTNPMTFDVSRELAPVHEIALVYAATGNSDLDRVLARKAQTLGIPACAVDQMEPSDFTTPAIVDRDPVVVAVGTEGTAPVLARRLKASIETFLEPSLGALAKVAQSLRPLVGAKTKPGQQRRAFWDHFFHRARPQPEQAEDIAHSLLTHISQPQAGLSFIDVPHGLKSMHPDAHQALHTADVVIFDEHVIPSVLDLARREALQLPQTKVSSDFLAQVFQNHQLVVLLKSKPSQDTLSDVAAGFGVLARVFPTIDSPAQGDVEPAELRQAA